MNQATPHPETHDTLAVESSSAQTRQHGLVYRAVVYGTSLPPGKRRRLYLVILLLALSLVWVPVSGVIFLTPARFTSEWTLILPGTGSGQAVNLESIGQATTNTASPFSNSSIDPIVNYKEIANSAPVLAKAAKTVGISKAAFGKPKIKLVDQTSLIHFEVKGATAEQARNKSLALFEALQLQLERLRTDEATRITASTLATFDSFNIKLQQSQQEKLAYQARTNLVSSAQFDQLVTRLEQDRATQVTLKASHLSLRARIEQIQQSLSLTPQDLRHAVTLRNDTLFQAQLQRHAEIHAQSDTVDAAWGDNHPRLNQLHAAHDSLNDALIERGRRITGNKRFTAAQLIDLGSNVVEGGLLQELVRLTSDEKGIAQELSVLNAGLEYLSQRIEDSAADAIKLEELSRKQQVATAVFSTALAKQDIGKVDRFASYPLLQMLAEPTLPENPDKLHLKLAMAGGIAATFFILTGLLLLWLRKPLLQQMLKSA